MKLGAIYAATGERYVQEARISVESLKRHMPGIHATLFTDIPIAKDDFDNIVQIPQPRRNRLDKIPYIGRVPYERALFLDSDTYVCGDLTDLFTLLDRFDIAMALAPRRILTSYPAFDDVPDSFTEFNSGVIAFQNTPAVRAMFDAWATHYAEALESEWFQALYARRGQTLQDQHFLRKALYLTDLRIATLPYEYNCRLVPGIVNGAVKILHGRHADLDKVAARINRNAMHKRLITPSRSTLYTIGAREQALLPYLALVERALAVRTRFRKMVRWFHRWQPSTDAQTTERSKNMQEVSTHPSR